MHALTAKIPVCHVSSPAAYTIQSSFESLSLSSDCTFMLLCGSFGLPLPVVSERIGCHCPWRSFLTVSHLEALSGTLQTCVRVFHKCNKLAVCAAAAHWVPLIRYYTTPKSMLVFHWGHREVWNSLAESNYFKRDLLPYSSFASH